MSKRQKSELYAACGEEVFEHKPNSYYGHLEHGYRLFRIPGVVGMGIGFVNEKKDLGLSSTQKS